MSTVSKLFKTMLEVAHSDRDRLLFILCANLRITSDRQIAGLTYGQAQALVRDYQMPDKVRANLQTRLLEFGKKNRLEAKSIIFKSILHWGRLTRTAIWKIIDKAVTKAGAKLAQTDSQTDYKIKGGVGIFGILRDAVNEQTKTLVEIFQPRVVRPMKSTNRTVVVHDEVEDLLRAYS